MIYEIFYKKKNFTEAATRFEYVVQTVRSSVSYWKQVNAGKKKKKKVKFPFIQRHTLNEGR